MEELLSFIKDHLGYVILGVLVLILLLVVYAHFSKPKCPKCKKRNASIVKKDFLRDETVYFRETQTIKEYSNTGAVTDFQFKGVTVKPPEKIITKEVKVPGTRKWYRATYKCGICGEQFSRKEYIDEKPKII